MVRRAIGAVAALALPIGLLVGVPASAQAVAARGVILDRHLPVSSGGPEVARGIVVRTSGTGDLLGARSALESLPYGIDVVQTRALGRNTDLLLFDELVPAAEAERVAEVLQDRADVAWAVADVRMHRTAMPVIPNDTYFDRMKPLWNGGGTTDFSVKAPLIWGQQKGSPSVVVAVIDTGITRHPDLDANVVAGYDFISDSAVANDGNGRDPEPADPGDWISKADTMTSDFEGCTVSDSSWHGTHVSGTIAGIQGNTFGITGVAPGARIQPVRVLGKCGGYQSDIAAAITWASGGSVSGVPANATPAKVINMSLGGDGVCDPLYQEAISGAIARGTTVVVAAGNETEPITQKRPANCAGVISVTAVDAYGLRAGYSNYGVAAGQATIAAPGGDFETDEGVLSTTNAGTQSPIFPGADGQWSFAFEQGTSMATPHVAGAAALLYSAGYRLPAQVRSALIAAVQPFPTYGPNFATWECTAQACGAGILDLSRLSLTAPITVPGAPVEVMATARSATEAGLSWTPSTDDGGAPISGYLVEASRDGGAYAAVTLTGSPSAAVIPGLATGSTYQFRVAAINSVGTGAYSLPSAPITLKPAATVPGAVSGFTKSAFTKSGTTYKVTVRWKPPARDGGSPITGYVARVGLAGRWSDWSPLLTDPATLLTNLQAKKAYSVEVHAVNAVGQGLVATYRVTTPKK